MLLSESGEIWRVEHADFDTIRAELGDQGRQKGSARWVGSFTGTAQGISEDAELEMGFRAKGFLEGRNLESCAVISIWQS